MTPIRRVAAGLLGGGLLLRRRLRRWRGFPGDLGGRPPEPNAMPCWPG